MYEIFTRCWANRDILFNKKLSSGEFPIMNGGVSYRLLSLGIGKKLQKNSLNCAPNCMKFSPDVNSLWNS